jgi:hypothetical protein
MSPDLKRRHIAFAGNWSEDEARFDLAARDYEVRRSKGELLHLRKAREKAFQTQRVSTDYARRTQRVS